MLNRKNISTEATKSHGFKVAYQVFRRTTVAPMIFGDRDSAEEYADLWRENGYYAYVIGADSD